MWILLLGSIRLMLSNSVYVLLDGFIMLKRIYGNYRVTLLVFKMEFLFLLSFLRVFGDRSIALAVGSIEIHFDNIRRGACIRNKLKKYRITMDSGYYVRLVVIHVGNLPYVLSNRLIGYRIPGLHVRYTILTTIFKLSKELQRQQPNSKWIFDPHLNILQNFIDYINHN